MYELFANIDRAMQKAYGDSLFSEGYEWLRHALIGLSLQEAIEVLVAENMHSVVAVLVK